METVIDVITRAGHSALDVALYTMLPIVVVMTIVLRLLEVWGVLDWLVKWVGPIVRPFGMTGLAALAILQGTLISFIAPLPTLKMMEERGASKRHLAAALAAVFATAPSNATYPLAGLGLQLGPTILYSIAGALTASAATYWVFGRRLEKTTVASTETVLDVAAPRPSLLSIINVSGGQAVRSIVGIIPMLMVSVAVVFGLQQAGVVTWLVEVLAAPFGVLGLDTAYILPTITKYLAGNTAMVALFHEMAKQSGFDRMLLQEGSGFLINPLDLPGIGIFLTVGPRVASVIVPAIAGGVIGILLRTVLTFVW